MTTATYHVGLEGAEKDAHFDYWRSGRATVMVSTTAFGAGVDFGSVRLVLVIQNDHLDDHELAKVTKPFTMPYFVTVIKPACSWR